MIRGLTGASMFTITALMAAITVGVAVAGRDADPTATTEWDAAIEEVEPQPLHIHVVDAQWKSVSGIAVQVLGADSPPRSFNTDNQGRAIIPGDAIGEGSLLLARRDRDAVAWAQVGDPTPGRPAGTRADPLVMRLLPVTHRVEGSVVNQDGKPIGGVSIAVDSLSDSTNGLWNQDLVKKDPLIGPVVTDAAGKFAVTLPQPATVQLRAVHARYLGPLMVVREGTQTLKPTTLQPAGGIVGKAIDATTGKPVVGAAVAAQLIEQHRRSLSDGWGQAVTDDQGRFAVGGLEPGVYNLLLLEVPGRGHATAAAVEGVRVKAGAEATADLSVIEGHPLRGVVIDRGNGRPMADAQVGCRGSALPQSGAAIMGTRTDEQGRFTFHVPPGEQFVYLIDDMSSNRMTRRVVVVPEQGEVIPLFLLQPAIGGLAIPPPPAPDEAVAVPEAPRGFAFNVAAGFVKAIAAKAPTDAPAAAPAPAVKRRTVTGRVRDTKGRPLAGIRVAVDLGPGRPDGLRAGEVFVVVDHQVVDRGPGRPDSLREQYGTAATDRDGTFVLGEFLLRQVPITLSRPRYQVQAEVVPADRNEVEVTYRLQPDDKARNQAALIEDESIPPELRPRLTLVDLTPYGNNYLTDGPANPGDGNNLDRLPRGVHKLADSYFRIGENLVQVKGQVSPNWPESVTGIKVAARGKKLHILHATEQQAEPGTELGNYVIHYADGSQEKVPIVYGKNLVDWWHFPSQKNDPTGAKIAWTGTNEMSDQKRSENLEIRLYAFTWTNPHPDREIATIDVVSSNSACDPYLIAVTVEREK